MSYSPYGPQANAAATEFTSAVAQFPLSPPSGSPDALSGIPSTPESPWRRSSYSGSTSNCVETARALRAGVNEPKVRIRDSKVAGGPELSVASGAWAIFLEDLTGWGTVHS